MSTQWRCFAEQTEKPPISGMVDSLSSRILLLPRIMAQDIGQGVDENFLPQERVCKSTRIFILFNPLLFMRGCPLNSRFNNGCIKIK